MLDRTQRDVSDIWPMNAADKYISTIISMPLHWLHATHSHIAVTCSITVCGCLSHHAGPAAPVEKHFDDIEPNFDQES